MRNLVDATRTFVFEIQDVDVREAKRHDKNNCVIANALRATPGVRGVEVGSRYTRIWTGKEVKRYTTPSRLSRALNAFDTCGTWGLPIGIYALKPPSIGRTLVHEREYEKNRTAEQIKNKRKQIPENKGRNRSVSLNPRVIEFAKMREERQKEYHVKRS